MHIYLICRQWVLILTNVANPVTESRKLSFSRGHYAVSDDFARCVLHIDDGVRREVFRKSVRKRNVMRLMLQMISGRKVLCYKLQSQRDENETENHYYLYNIIEFSVSIINGRSLRDRRRFFKINAIYIKSILLLFLRR